MLALLDELDIVKGKVEMNGKVFYVSQEPWIFNASIKQNILFGVPYDETKFKEIVRVACLEQVGLRVFVLNYRKHSRCDYLRLRRNKNYLIVDDKRISSFSSTEQTL